MSVSIEGQIAVVTGAANGIGREIALQLARSKVNIAILDIDEKGAGETKNNILEEGNVCKVYNCDVSDKMVVTSTFELLSIELGLPTILINNAGIYKSGDLLTVSENEWGNILSVNLTGAFWCSQAMAPFLRRSQFGRIINIASIGGKVGWPKNHAYCASKSGLIGLTRVLAVELAGLGTTVNAVCPGNTDTAMMTAVDSDICNDNNWKKGQFKKKVIQNIPVKRLGLPSDVANLVVFLCQPTSDFINGQAINVDGGLVMW